MAHQSFFKHQMPSRVDRKIARDKLHDAIWRGVCQEVDQRDKRICRCCGKRTNPEDVGLLRGHRHHLKYRSAGGQDMPENLLTLCARCHQDEHHAKLKIEILDRALGGNGPCEFWHKDEHDQWFLWKREIAVGRVEKD